MDTRKEKKERRRQEILYAALELFVTKGYAATKITDIAKSANMSRGLMFHYFESKEKLYEELLNVKELTKPTYHEKIMIATVREYDYDEVKERIENLVQLSYTYDQMKIVAAMKDIVPEFVSKNSCFEALDKKD